MTMLMNILPEIDYSRNNLDNKILLHFYEALLKPRLIEEKMLILLRQGKISKWFSGIGQEAIAVGCALALSEDEYILPLHRNLGIFTTRKVPLDRLFSQFQGKMNGFSKGRERSFHFGSNEHHIVGLISHLGPQLSVADGIALAHKLNKERKVTLVFSGDGGASQGEFHEALNVAAVWDLPVIFIIENNGYGLSTPSSEQYRCKSFVDKGIGYGIEAIQIDGNNILEVYDTIKKLAESIRENPRPVMVECITFRMRGHEEASGTKYVPKELFEQWKKKDPVKNFESFLLAENVLNEEIIEDYKKRISSGINGALESAFSEENIIPDTAKELIDIYYPAPAVLTTGTSNLSVSGGQISSSDSQISSLKSFRFIDAISDSLRQSMRKFPNLIIMGQDVAEYGGAFKVTENFSSEFGKDRVRNTPLCESAIIGVALGLSVKGYKSVVEMQFADFVTCGFNQIVNNLAKIHWRWGQQADVVIRMPTGAGVGGGPFHSQSNEAWFTHIPGLKVVYPAFPYDAKGLLAAAIEDENPILFFEHKALYRSIKDEVPDDYYTLEIGKANLVKEGKDLTVISYGLGVHWALEALNENPEISADLIDLRTLLPLDEDAIFSSVKKTGKAIILHEDTLTGGIGGEISARINEHCFEFLDAPVVRSASLDTPVPFSTELEWNFLPKERFKKQLRELWMY